MGGRHFSLKGYINEAGNLLLAFLKCGVGNVTVDVGGDLKSDSLYHSNTRSELPKARLKMCRRVE